MGKTLIFGDNYSLMVPGKIFTAYWLRHGLLPLWNPYLLGGLPWIEDINQSVLYPSTGLFMLLNPAWALNVTLIAHYGVTFIGMWLLAKRWTSQAWLAVLAGLGWMLSTQVAGSSNNVSTIQSIVWLPWLLWLGELVPTQARARWWFGLVACLQFLGGYPQHVVYSILAAVVFSWGQRWRGPDDGHGPVAVTARAWWRAWVLTGFWTLAVSAVAWVPFAEQLLRSTRIQQTASQAAVGSLNPVMMVKTVLPYFFDKPTAGMKWGPAWSGQPNMVFYLGWVCSAVVGWVSLVRRRASDWFLGGVVFSTLIVSLGTYLPGFSALQAVMPWFRIGRYPSMLLIVTTVAVWLWVVTCLPKVRLSWRWFKLGVASFSFLALIGSIGWWQAEVRFGEWWRELNTVTNGWLSRSPFHTPERDQVIVKVVAQDLLVTSLLAIAALWLVTHRRWALLTIVVALDLVYHTQANYFWAPNRIYPSWSEVNQQWGKVGSLSTDDTHRWLTRNSNQPYTDFGSYWEAMVVRAPFSDSFVNANELQTFDHAIALRRGQTLDWNMVAGVPMIHGYTTLMPQDFVNQWPNPQQQVQINFLPKLDLNDATTLQLLSRWAVRYYLVDTWFELTPSDTFGTWPSVSLDDRWRIYRLPSLSRFRDEREVPVALQALAETPNSQYLELSNPDGAAQLVIADRFDRGWRAWINGQPTQIHNVDGQRRLELPTTQPDQVLKVVLRYQPRWWWLGASVSMVSLVGWVLWLRQDRFSSRQT